VATQAAQTTLPGHPSQYSILIPHKNVRWLW